MDIRLTGEDRWAWGRNGEIRRPEFVTVKTMGRGEIWLSVFATERTLQEDRSPIDLHMSKEDAGMLAAALLNEIAADD